MTGRRRWILIPIPEGTDFGGQESGIIYCKPFRVLFSVGPLTPVGA